MKNRKHNTRKAHPSNGHSAPPAAAAKPNPETKVDVDDAMIEEPKDDVFKKEDSSHGKHPHRS